MIETEQVTLSSSDGVETVACSGELTLNSVGRFHQALAAAAESGMQIVIDFRQASYIDTAYVAALVAPAKVMTARGGRLKVLVVEGTHPQYVLKVVGFGDLMDIAPEASGAAKRDEAKS